MPEQARRARRLAAAAIVALAVLAYLPSLRNGFIWDDDRYVTDNTELRSAAGLASIWLTPGAPEHLYHQYYPLVHTTFWVEHHLWGDHAAGYHAVNVLLHALCALLAWRVLVRLRVRGAWLAAALFAVHPVHVESVAWITERKNLLSAAFALGATLAWLGFAGLDPARPSAAGRARWYGLAFGLFACALLSKTVACTLPVAFLLVLWWKRGRIRAREVAQLAPFLAAGLALGLLTASIERTSVGAAGAAWDLSLAERCLIAGRAVCFYAAKLAWPSGLTFIYPRWALDAGDARQWLFVAAVAAAIAALWAARRRIGKGPLVAALFFVLTLSPALGFVDVYPMRFSFVADHFQYLASVGPIALVAAAGASLAAARGARVVLAAAALAALGSLTWQRQAAYANEEQLWRDTLARNPACWMAHNNLGMVLVRSGREPEAVAHFEAALALNPDDEKAQCNLGTSRLKAGRVDDAIEHLQRAVRIDPGYPEARNNLGTALAHAGRPAEAFAQYEQALRLRPDYAEAHYNFALALAAAGRLDDAVAHYEDALRIEPANADAHNNLGNALAQAGRLQEALPHFERAVQLDPRSAAARANLARAQALLRAGPPRGN
jgi:tetratricopeptide (TPR) repeat protein